MAKFGRLLLRTSAGSLKRVVPESVYVKLKNRVGKAIWDIGGEMGHPPPSVKVECIRQLHKAYGVDVFVETGTYKGDMIAALTGIFKQLYSVELDPLLFARAQNRFADCRRVHIFNGNSAEVIRRILESIHERCMFWLDAHYSGSGTAGEKQDCPLILELQAIRSHKRNDHIILIDDIGCMGHDCYPTVCKLCKTIEGINPEYRIEVRDNVLRAHPFGENRKRK